MGIYDKYYDQGFKAKKLSDNDGHVPFVPWHRPHRVLGYGVAEMMAAPWWCHRVRKNHRFEGQKQRAHTCHVRTLEILRCEQPLGHQISAPVYCLRLIS